MSDHKCVQKGCRARFRKEILLVKHLISAHQWTAAGAAQIARLTFEGKAWHGEGNNE
jgi:hypothetical protein